MLIAPAFLKHPFSVKSKHFNFLSILMRQKCFLIVNSSLNIIFVVTDKVLHYLKKFDYLFLTITIYLLSIGLFYIPMGIFQREYLFETFNESAPCTLDTNLICTADIFWTCIRYCFLGPVGYMMFSFLFHKVSYMKLGKYISYIVCI